MSKSTALIPVELEDLSKVRMAELNGEGYKAGDIRTYKVIPLADNPARDIEIHENLRSENGRGSVTMHTNIGVTLGTTHSTSMQQASNKVFHFPKATEIKNTLLVKKVDVSTPYPLWMINRYGLESFRGNLTHTQATNIYLNKKTGAFFILFDEDFLRGVAFEELIGELTKEELEFVSVARGKREYLQISTNDLTEITGKGHSNFDKVKQKIIDAYTSLFITTENTSKVICLSIKSNNPETRRFHTQHITPPQLSALIAANGAAMDLSFVVAAERQGKFYPIKEDGTIVTNEPFYFSRRHADSQISPLRRDKDYEYGDYIDEKEFAKESTLIIPYTDEDYAFIKGVVERLNAVKMELINFFKLSEVRGEGGDISMTLAIGHYKGNSPLLALENK